jgi:hypothetical protein
MAVYRLSDTFSIPTWGTIVGTLADQDDLDSALAAKISTAPTADQTITSQSATVTPLIIKGHASQSDALLSLTKSDGTNVMTCDNSGGLTGLAFGAWVSVGPSLVNITIGNGTYTCFYKVTGQVVHFHGRITLGTTSSLGANTVGINLPFTAKRVGFVGTCVYGDTGSFTLGGACQVDTTSRIVFVMSNSTANFGLVGSSNPHTWAATDTIDFNITYEAA